MNWFINYFFDMVDYKKYKNIVYKIIGAACGAAY